MLGHSVVLVKRPTGAAFGGLETCGSVWSCPVCSAKILAARADELRSALETWDAQGGRVAMVTLTMRHRRNDDLALCWDALGDAWRAASGGYSRVRAAKLAAGVEGWVRRVEATWGARHGWHVHVHALVFLRDGDRVDDLGAAMYAAWEARLDRVGLTPIRDRGGLDVKLLDLAGAVEEVGAYVAKGAYNGERAALELTGPGKLGRMGNLSPWQLLDAARTGDPFAGELWREWETTSLGRRALTWSQGLRERLQLDQEADDEELADDQAGDVVAVWRREDWPALRDAPTEDRNLLLRLVEYALDPIEARQAVEAVVRLLGLPEPIG